MSAPYCLTFGHAGPGETCHECGWDLSIVSAFVSVGLLDVGRLCEDCGLETPVGHLAEALDRLDTAVKLAGGARQQGAAALTVLQAVQHLVDDEWLPLAHAGMGQAK